MVPESAGEWTWLGSSYTFARRIQQRGGPMPAGGCQRRARAVPAIDQ